MVEFCCILEYYGGVFQSLNNASMKILNRLKEFPPSSVALDWVVALFSIWFVGGVFTDGWAHNHLNKALETFFTPWHALFYSGFTALAVAIGVVWYLNYKKGYHWKHAWPRGYRLAAVGILVFFIGGAGDLVWHLLFGIEASVDALLSPTHLVLAIGGALTVSAPLRSAFARSTKATSLLRELPGIISLTAVFSLALFMTQYLNPVTHPWLLASKQTSDVFFGQALGISNFIYYSIALTGFLLYVNRRRALPFGATAILVGLSTLGMAAMKDTYYLLPWVIGAGLLIDVKKWYVVKRYTGNLRIQLLAVAIAVIATLGFLAGSLFHGGTWWSIHLLAGAVAVSAIAGWLVSFLALPIEK